MIPARDPRAFRSRGASFCYCGHTGNVSGLEHAGGEGRGRCLVYGCDCVDYWWAWPIDSALGPPQPKSVLVIDDCGLDVRTG